MDVIENGDSTKKMDSFTITTQKTTTPIEIVETVLCEDMGAWLKARGLRILKGWWRGNQYHIVAVPIISADIPSPAEGRP